MADAKPSSRTTSSPLFDKMDALLARHRGAAEALDIPILLEEALEETSIPILTDIVQGDELMFDLGDLRPAPHVAARSSHIAPPPAAADEFLNSPLFDLDSSIEPDAQDEVLTPLLTPEEEKELQVPTIGFIPEPATIMPVDDLLTLKMPEITFSQDMLTPFEDAPATEEIDICPAEDEQDWADGLSLTESVLPLGETLDLDVTLEPADFDVTREPAALDVMLKPANLDATLKPAELDAVLPPAKPEATPEPTGLSEAAITEITAAVAAQIAVEVSTEISQLTRQHFSKMMNTFYSESLRQLTDEISRDMEMCLAPRIEELVRTELRRQGKTK